MAIWPNGSSSIPTCTGEFGPRTPIWTSGGWTSSFHRGIDLIWPDRIIRAPVSGVVTVAGYNGGAGLEVRIRRPNGDDIRLFHNSRIDVSVGQAVAEGQPVAIMGTTGQSTGVHCHMETHRNGVAINPRVYIADNPSGGSPGGTTRRDYDMARNCGIYWEEGNNTIVYANFNTESGFWADFSNGTGAGAMPSAYNNALAGALDTTSWAKVTQSHAMVIKRACAAVLAANTK